MGRTLLVPAQACSDLLSRSASIIWQHAPCAVATRKVVLPRLHEVHDTMTSGMPLAKKASNKAAKHNAKRPLRQRLCRFVFREFVRSCDLKPSMRYLEHLTPWQAALGVGALGALLMWILA